MFVMIRVITVHLTCAETVFDILPIPEEGI